MNTNFLKLSLLALVIFTASCSSDDDKNNTIPVVETIKVSDLDASPSNWRSIARMVLKRA